MYVSNSKSFEYAKKYISQNEEILEKIGDIRSIRLSYFDFGISISGTSHNAQFKVIVRGKKNDGIVFIKIKKVNNTWAVKNCFMSIDNKQVIKIE